MSEPMVWINIGLELSVCMQMEDVGKLVKNGAMKLVKKTNEISEKD